MQRLLRSRAWLYPIDAGLVVFGYYLAFMLKFGVSIPMFNFTPFLRLIPWIFLLVLAVFWLLELYAGTRRQLRELVGTVIIAVFLLNLVTMATAFIGRGFSFPRSVFVLAAPLQIMFIIGWRLIWRLGSTAAEGTVILLGGEFAGNERIRRAITQEYGKRLRLEIASSLSQAEVEGFIQSRLRGCKMLFLGDSVSSAIKKRLVYECMSSNKEICLVPDVYDIILNRVRLNRLADYPVLELGSLTLTDTQRVAKRAFDLILALLGLSLSLPLMLPIGVAIILSSPGPVFFRQERVGLQDRRFTLIKFRSMIADAEQRTGPVLAAEKDPRITKIGAFLRATHLDELPQLFNVLKGEMSFVGPRPERSFFVERFAGEIPEYPYRHMVKPGLTGLAQVRGRYDTDPSNKLRFDLYYINNYSPVLDLRIILQTMRQVVLPEGSRESGPRAAAETIKNTIP